MRRKHWLGALMIALFLCVFLMGCESSPKTITSIKVDSSSIKDNVDISDFNISDLKIIVFYSDDTFDIISVTESMLTPSDIAKLSYMGTHDITVTYEGISVSLSIELSDAQTTTYLQQYYQYAIEYLGFVGTYDTWIQSLVSGGPNTILFAAFNQENELIITFSNNQTLNLGKMNPQTVTVYFYDFYGTLISSAVVEKGGSVVPPNAPDVENYQFVEWFGIYTNVQVDTEVIAIYNYTGQSLAGFDDADELLISLSRLEEAQFGVDLDAIFSNAKASTSIKRSRNLREIIYERTMMDTSDGFDPMMFIPHTYWSHQKYHPGLYQMPTIIDGYHVITSTLTSYSTHSLNNLYDVNTQVATSSRAYADWAVDYLTVMDTWVIQDDFKYLLHYNEVLDRVELYAVWTYAPSSIIAYTKIFVYYNQKGEEVVETWNHQIYSDSSIPGYPGVMVYHNAIGGRDFNYYAVWLDENYEPTNMRHYRGINMNPHGEYEYYDNNYLMISGEYGWYTLNPYIDFNRETIDFPTTPIITVYSPDASCDVMTVYGSSANYSVEIYLPAMHGVDALLVQEGGMIKKNQDSEAVQNMLINQGYDLMPDWYEVDRYNNDIRFGFKTSKGTFFADREQVDYDVRLDYVHIDIGSEGRREYDHYHNYFGRIALSVNASSLKELIEKLNAYFDEIGLSYKFGDINELFKELGYVYENYKAIGEKISITNESLSLPLNRYTSMEDYLANEAAIVSYLDIKTIISELLSNKPSMQFTELPSKNDLNAISLIKTENGLTGELSMIDGVIYSSSLQATLRQSPLLQNNQSYSLFYGLRIGGKIIELGHETPQIYEGQKLTFNGNISFEIPDNLPIGEYQFVVFFAKVIGDAYLRVSSVSPWKFNEFSDVIAVQSDDVTEVSIETNVKYYENHLFITVKNVDRYAPKVTLYLDDTPYQGEHTIEDLLLPYEMTVSEFMQTLHIKDNVDGIIEPLIGHLTHNDQSVNPDDMMMGSGWVYQVSDNIGNLTKITIQNITGGYTVTWYVDNEIYDQILVASGTTITQIEVPTLVGRMSVGWDDENLTITSNQVYHSVYTINTYNVTWMYKEEIVQEDLGVAYGSLLQLPQMPPIEGYIFIWQLVDGGTMPANDLIVNGDYVKAVYNIVYFIDDVFYAIQELFYGDTIMPPSVTPPTGKVFSGWDITYTIMPADHLVVHGSFVDAETT